MFIGEPGGSNRSQVSNTSRVCNGNIYETVPDRAAVINADF